MSDAAKTPEEIEDVLASVRRLVSDAGSSRKSAPRPQAQDAPAQPPEAPRPDALVLTPSFRVTDPEDPWVTVPTSEAPAPAQSDETPADTAQAAPEDLIAELLTTASDAETDADADTDANTSPREGDADWQPDDRLASFDAVGASGEGHTDGAEDTLDDAAADFESETGDDNWPSSGAEAALLTLVARRDPAPVEDVDTGDDGATGDATPEGRDQGDHAQDAETHTDDTPDVTDHGGADHDGADGDEAHHDEARQDEMGQDEIGHGDSGQDGSGHAADTHTEHDANTPAEDAPHDDAPEHAPHDDAPEHAPHDDAPHHTDADHEDVSDDSHDEDHGGDHGDDTGEAIESASDAADETPDAAPEDTPSEDTAQPHILHAAPPDAEIAAETTVEDFGDAESPFTFPEADEGILDEETLREIIVDVVREELQGVLGQRITRNVRKLVRREIRLVLAAEDLE